MNKLLIYIVATAIVILLGFDAYLALTGQATATSLVELAVGAGAIIAFSAAALVRTVGGFRIGAGRTGTVESKLDEILEELSACRDTIGETNTAVENAREDFDSRLGLKPDAWEATVNTVDEHGKLVPVYALAPEDSQEEAVCAARTSLEARDAEGNPVENARITLRPVFY